MPTKAKPKSSIKQVDKSSKSTGRIVQIIGPVVDVEFEKGNLPDIYSALEIKTGKETLICEVEQHLGENMVRALALGSTDGLKRGLSVTDTRAPIQVPVGEETLGRIFNVFGAPIDNKGEVKTQKLYPIHRESPSLVEQETKPQILETGIKVIDLLSPFLK